MKKAPTYCRQPGCPNYGVDRGYCEEHKIKIKEYDSYAWKKLRRRVKRKYPLCEICKARGETSLTTVVHHIIEVASGGEFYDPSNLQALCRDCHDEIHGRR